MFTDDCVLFCKAKVATNSQIKQLIYMYEAVSGQQVNPYKTVMSFSHNTSAQSREDIRRLWTNGSIQQYELYLGLPLMVGRSKIRAFEGMKNKV